jgi:hypothetical protein
MTPEVPAQSQRENLMTTSTLRRYAAHWHCLVHPGSHVTNVVVDGEYSTEKDIPAIIAVDVWGTNRNADLVVIENLVPIG